MKPVSQARKKVGRLTVDPDVFLIKEYFGLPHDLESMSPVVVVPGYTRDYIDGKITDEAQMDSVVAGFDAVARNSDMVLIEGMGHTGVGSIINLNNARVAKQLNADVVLVANGGLGSAYDELELNRVLCKEHGVRIRGVVLNRVRPDKLEMVQDYFSKLLERNWGVPLLGCVPNENFLGQPTLSDLEDYFGTELMTGHRDRLGHYDVNRAQLVVTDLRSFMKMLEAEHPTRMLYLTHCSRDDIILGFLSHCQRMRQRGYTAARIPSYSSGGVGAGGSNFEAALLLCGHHTEDFYGAIQDMASATDFPIMKVPMTTHDTLLALKSFVPKLNTRDKVRTKAVIDHCK